MNVFIKIADNSFKSNKLALLRNPLKKITSLTATCSYLVMTMTQSFAMDGDVKESTSSIGVTLASSSALVAIQGKLEDGSECVGSKSTGLECESDSEDESSYILSAEDITLSNHHAQALDPIEYALSIIQGRLEYNQNLIDELTDTDITPKEKVDKIGLLMGMFNGKSEEDISSVQYVFNDGTDMETYISRIATLHFNCVKRYNNWKNIIEKMRCSLPAERAHYIKQLYVMMLNYEKVNQLNRKSVCEYQKDIGEMNINYDEASFLNVVSDILCRPKPDESFVRSLRLALEYTMKNEKSNAIYVDATLAFSKAENSSINIDHVFSFIQSCSSNGNLGKETKKAQLSYTRYLEDISNISRSFYNMELLIKSKHERLSLSNSRLAFL